MNVTLYTKADCGLCEEAEVMLRKLQRNIRFELEFVDIEASEEAHKLYWHRIPVVVVDGEEVAAAPLNAKQLDAILRR